MAGLLLFAERHGRLRSAVAEVLTERAATLGLSLALRADQLATVDDPSGAGMGAAQPTTADDLASLGTTS